MKDVLELKPSCRAPEPATRLRVQHGLRTRPRSVEWRRIAAGCVGLGVLAIAVLSPVDEWAQRLFWVHMLQHLLLLYLAAPLLAIAVPLALPGSGHPPRRARMAWLTSPVCAFCLSTVVLWLWHLPAAYELALQNDPVHALEHLSFLGAFGLYWWELLAPAPSSHLRSNGARTLYLLAGATQAMLLGALITLSDHVLYAHYLLISRPSGLSSLADQQLGGALMWLSGPVIYGLAAVLVMRDE